MVSAGCDTNINDDSKSTRIAAILRGDNVPIRTSDIDMVMKGTHLGSVTQAAINGFLTDFLDTNSVNTGVISKALMTDPIIKSLENVLQVLWYGADIENTDDDYMTPIMLASEYGTLEIVTTFAKINVSDCRGRTPLHFATKNTPVVVSKLLESGSNCKNTWETVKNEAKL